MAVDLGYDDRWLDLDFSKQPEYTFGCKPETEVYGNFYEDAVPILTEAQIRAALEGEEALGGGADLLVTRIFDQKQEGSCVANAVCQGHQIVQGLQYGKEGVIDLSAISLYKRIGRSPGSGANVGHGLQEIAKRGAIPLDTPENRAIYGDKVMPNTGFYTPYVADWENTASLLTVLEYYTIRSLEGMKTALVLGHPVIVGRQGHSICYCRLLYKNGRYSVRYANSWHERWGDKGFGYDSESQMRMSAGQCFAIRAVRRAKP